MWLGAWLAISERAVALLDHSMLHMGPCHALARKLCCVLQLEFKREREKEERKESERVIAKNRFID